MPFINCLPLHRLTLLATGSLLLAGVIPAEAQSTPPPFVFTHLAGPAGGYGNADGPAAAARFWNPGGLALDSAGNLYVGDAVANRVRKITPAGVVSTLPGTGDTNPALPPWLFSRRKGVAVDSSGTVYVSDSRNHTIYKITPGGVVTVLAGGAGAITGSGSADGAGTAATFNDPLGLALDSAGNLYVADSLNYTIRKISPAGVVTTFAGMPPEYGNPHGAGVNQRLAHPGSADGIGTAAQFQLVAGVAVDGPGNVFVADEYNHTIRKITPTGVVTTLAGTAGQAGSADGTGADARFHNPQGVAVDAAGNVFVTDTANATLRKITPAGVVTTLAGTAGQTGTVDGTGATARFCGPSGLVVDPAGNLYVGDGDAFTQPNDHAGTIRKVTPAGVVTTVAGLAGGRGSADGTGTAARFDGPQGVAVDAAGNVYVADKINHTIRKITAGGAVSTLAGTAGQAGSVDGTGTAALFNSPTGTAVDAAGNVYVADNGNSTIRKITPAGAVTTLAGAPGQFGSADGTGLAAQFHNPVAVAVDSTGSLYVADGDYIASGDPTFQYGTIRKVTPGGAVTTLAGSPVVPSYKVGPFDENGRDGTGAAARFNHPIAVAVDANGMVYVADYATGKVCKITPDGTSTALAGLKDETGAPATFISPSGVAVDPAGNVYVSEASPNRLRKVTPAGVVTTVAGSMWILGSADGVGADAQFNTPAGIALDAAGNLYVADSHNNAIRKGQPAGPPVITTQPQSLSAAAGSNVQLSVTVTALPAPTYQWFLNGSPFTGATASTLGFANARATDAGDYTVTVTNAAGTVTSSKATLTISAAPATAPSTPAAGTGGGGSIEGWFVLALLLLGLARKRP